MSQSFSFQKKLRQHPNHLNLGFIEIHITMAQFFIKVTSFAFRKCIYLHSLFKSCAAFWLTLSLGSQCLAKIGQNSATTAQGINNSLRTLFCFLFFFWQSQLVGRKTAGQRASNWLQRQLNYIEKWMAGWLAGWLVAWAAAAAMRSLMVVDGFGWLAGLVCYLADRFVFLEFSSF